MKNHFDGGTVSSSVYEAPSMSLQTFSAEAGFAQSNGIDRMDNWENWED